MEIIAEIGQAHDGSLGIAHSFIDALAGTGVTAVKFQTHIAAAESSPDEPFRIKFSYEDNTRQDYWRRMEFTRDQWAELKTHAEQVGLTFISSPFSVAALQILESIGTKVYKIGSGEVSNHFLLDLIGRTEKRVLLSSGMSKLQELRESFKILKTRNCDVALLQCTSLYPAPPTTWGLNLIPEFKKIFGVEIGYSDHSGDVYACLAATAMGAELLEFHVVFDKAMFGPDSSSSIEMRALPKFIKGVKDIRTALDHPLSKEDNIQNTEYHNIFGKALAVNQSMTAGAVIEEEHLETKKPASNGISASEYRMVIGKRLRSAKKQWDFIQYEDIIWNE